MKHDTPTPEEIRQLIDDFRASRPAAMEYSTISRDDWNEADRRVMRILRYALRCALGKESTTNRC